VCREYKISCAEIILREDVTVDQFIDVLEGNRAYIPVLYVFNKIDAITIEELDILDQMPVSGVFDFVDFLAKLKGDKFSLKFFLSLAPCFLPSSAELCPNIFPAQMESGGESMAILSWKGGRWRRVFLLTDDRSTYFAADSALRTLTLRRS
jgi:C-terminal region of MMR_HSR1 domain